MKKTIFTFFISLLMLATSCKKNSSAVSGNSWTFKGITYPNTQCTDVSGQLSPTCTSTNQTLEGASMTINFPNGTNPITNHTYSVVAYNYGVYSLNANQVAIVMVTGISTTLDYYSTGSSTAQINVTVGTNGFLTVTGSGITLQNPNDLSDSSSLSLNITQTQ